MDVLRVFFFSCYLLISVYGNDSDKQNADNIKRNKLASKIELFPPTPTSAGQTRRPRTLFKKLHSGAAFLAGLKLGTILSKKGFELGHGKIASTHSFRVFGKSVNSAMSLAYGNTEHQLLPLAGEQEDDSLKRTLKKGDKKVFRVTVIENPSNETMEIFDELPVKSDEKETTQNDIDSKTLLLYQDLVEENPVKELETNFIEEHNKKVEEFNESILKKKNNQVLVPL